MADLLRGVKEVRLVKKLAEVFRPKSPDVVVSIGDDTAVVKGPKGKYTLYTSDMLVEGVHFRKDDDLEKVGYKAVAVCVSDIAAMGGEPKYVLVSVGMRKVGVEVTLRALMNGLQRCAEKFHFDVIGGDTNSSPHLVIDCCMVGEVERSNVVLRKGACAGDHVFVTGPLGGSCEGRHLVFEPRVPEARFLVKNFHVTSMIDLSDGLAMDLSRLAQASQVGAILEEDKIPKNTGVANVERALFDGEDFELLFTLSQSKVSKLMELSKKKGFKFYPIGRIHGDFEGVRLINQKGDIREPFLRGFNHF